jgi:hypothetical protein
MKKHDARKEIFEAMILHDDACFLCGAVLKKNKTREHVFPKWLLRMHGLEQAKIVLLNGTSFPYQHLTIPCCAKCNNEHLSRLESEIRSAFLSGYKAVRKLTPLTLYKWLGKIFYGILRKELQLYADLKHRENGTIIPPDLIEEFSSLHLFLQSIRRPFKFHGGEHFSVLVIKRHHGGSFVNFDFRDNLNMMLVAICSNDVGVIVALQDAGITRETYGRYVRKVRGRALIPMQFDELYAKVLYQRSLMTRVPKFVTAVHDDPTQVVDVHMLSIGGLCSTPIVRDWNQEEYARCFSAVLRPKFGKDIFDELFVPPSQVKTWMNNQTGKLTFWNADESLCIPQRRTTNRSRPTGLGR